MTSTASEISTTADATADHSRRQRLLRGLAAVAIGVAGLAVTAHAADAAAPPSSVTTGAAVVSDTHLSGGKVDYAVVSSGSHVKVSGRYSVGATGSAIDQIQIGWAGSSVPLGCIYNGSGSTDGSFTYDLGAPPAGQVNDVIVNFAQDFGCLQTSHAWWSSNQGPAIAEVAKKPANSGTNGIAKLKGVKLNGSGSNVVKKSTATPVALSGSYTIASTGGAIDQIQVGWQGSTAPAACVYNGGGPASGTFNVTLPAPPNPGANYVVFHYAQDFSCNLNSWWGGSSVPPQAAPVALYYNTTVAP